MGVEDGAVCPGVSETQSPRALLDHVEVQRFFKAFKTAWKNAGASDNVVVVPTGNMVDKHNNGLEVNDMANVRNSLKKIMSSIDGAIGVALVDFDGGLTLGTAGGGSELNLDIAGAGNLEVVRAKVRVMEALGLDDQIEDILITLGKQYHLIRPLVSHPTMFLYLAIHRDQGNLGMARHHLRAIENDLEV